MPRALPFSHEPAFPPRGLVALGYLHQLAFRSHSAHDEAFSKLCFQEMPKRLIEATASIQEHWKSWYLSCCIRGIRTDHLVDIILTNFAARCHASRPDFQLGLLYGVKSCNEQKTACPAGSLLMRTDAHCFWQDCANQASYTSRMSSHLIDTSDEEDCIVALALYISDLLDEGKVNCNSGAIYAVILPLFQMPCSSHSSRHRLNARSSVSSALKVD